MTTAEIATMHEEIRALAQEREAVILAHNYQVPEVQDVADFVGDSLGLSREAASTDADSIVFCGVHFMAETAAILSPEKTVLIPDLDAGCSLASGCPADKFRAWQAKHPGSVTISYINCSAEVKAASDLICTSSNAEKIVRSVPPEQRILFGPDKNLWRYLIEKTGRDMLRWQGSCLVHETFSERKLIGLRARHPEAEIIAHPECEPPVLKMASFIGSTSALLKYAVESPRQEFIVVTEPGIIHQMEKAAPHKTFVPAPPNGNCACNECPFMRLNTLEKLYVALRDLTPELHMTEELRVQALKPIERMLALS